MNPADGRFSFTGFVAPSASVRLTQIRLAGFKSFVDPTTVSIPGNWSAWSARRVREVEHHRRRPVVLGESRASALRGDSMQM